MRDLLREPAWQEKDLGMPLPDDLHAVSVCLPSWSSVIGYEESLEKVTSQLQCGYPRFFKHPMINRLIAEATEQICKDNEALAIFPNTKAAQRAQFFVEKRISEATRISSYGDFQCLIVPEKHISIAMEFWRYTGEIICSRQAADFFANTPAPLPHTDAILTNLTALTGAEKNSLYLYENGMAAAFATFRAINEMRSGKKTLQLEFPYVDTLKIQQHFGSGVVYLNECEDEPLREAISRIKKGEFSAVFCEFPSNPLLRSVDLPLLAKACKEGGVLLVVDDTVSSGYNVDVSPYADIITTSLTKWVSGKGNVMAGCVQVTKHSQIRDHLLSFFQTDNPTQSKIYSGDETVLLSNMAGFQQRMETTNANGLAIANLLANHPAVDQVWHPAYTTTASYEQLMRPDAGYGGLISFTLKSPKRAPKVFDRLKMSKGPSLGTEFSLASPYTLLAHYDELEWAENCGVASHLIRLSIGTEPISQLTNALEEALEFA